MGSDSLDDPICNDESDSPDDVVDSSHPNKRKRGKVPKKVKKAERERLKREQLNELFSKLACVLGNLLSESELNEESNGKACVLNGTIRLLKDLMSHIHTLRKENATLLSESQYMTAEKNELQDETTSLEVQVKKMRNELDERLAQSKPDLNVSPLECWQTEMPSHFMEPHVPQIPTTNPSSQPPPVLGPLYVIPINPSLQDFQKTNGPLNPPITVSKPHARYPTPADSWPLQLQLLSKQAETPPSQITP